MEDFVGNLLKWKIIFTQTIHYVKENVFYLHYGPFSFSHGQHEKWTTEQET